MENASVILGAAGTDACICFSQDSVVVKGGRVVDNCQLNLDFNLLGVAKVPIGGGFLSLPCRETAVGTKECVSVNFRTSWRAIGLFKDAAGAITEHLIGSDTRVNNDVPLNPASADVMFGRPMVTLEAMADQLTAPGGAQEGKTFQGIDLLKHRFTVLAEDKCGCRAGQNFIYETSP